MDTNGSHVRELRASWVLQACAVALTIPLLVEIFLASRWPLVHDAPILHYIVFLMSKGFIPYIDIVDMNSPGAYLLESLGMHLFGGDARGWFLWDLAGAGMVIFGSAWVAGPGRRAAGVMAGSLTTIIHLADGASNIGQRDWIVAGLLLLSFGCIFQMLRGGHAAWLGGAAFFVAVAATVKPPAILFGFLVLGSLASSGCKEPRRAFWWSMGGFLAPVAVVGCFLVKWHALDGFIAALTGLIPCYASLQETSLLGLIGAMLGRLDLLFLALALVAFCMFLLRRGWSSYASAALLLGALAAIAYYVWQDKGWAYHRYPAVAFGSLFMVMEMERGIRAAGARARIAWPALAVLAILLPCAALARERKSTYRMGTLLHLQADLTRLGGPQLSGRIQCLDMTHGECINALYRLQLVQSTGFIYDFVLFPERSTAVTDALQSRFMRLISARPPCVFVLSEQDWPGGGRGYAQLMRWPAFAQFLQQNYALETQHDEGPADMSGYRIYVLR
jgi:hypothetical protein